jgi:hypothetical protein
MNPFYLDVDGATHQANFDANTAAKFAARSFDDQG